LYQYYAYRSPKAFWEVLPTWETQNRVPANLLNRQVLNSSMLHPNQTPTRAATGGFSAPKAESQSKNAMQPTQSNIRTIQPAKRLGLVARNENKPEIVSKASPAKIDQRPPTDKIIKLAINNVSIAKNLKSIFFMAGDPNS